MSIRPMSRADVRDVVAIERDSYALPWSAATFRALLQRRNTLLRVAEDRRGVAGYAVLWLAAEEAELGNLAVRPGRRQRGIGRLLLQHVLEEAAARGARAIFLEVRESNSVALRLYEGAGFRVVGTRPDYYASPREAALVMRLDRVGCSLTSPPGGR